MAEAYLFLVVAATARRKNEGEWRSGRSSEEEEGENDDEE